MTWSRLIADCQEGQRYTRLQTVEENKVGKHIALIATKFGMIYYGIVSLFTPNATPPPVGIQAASTWPGRPPGAVSLKNNTVMMFYSIMSPTQMRYGGGVPITVNAASGLLEGRNDRGAGEGHGRKTRRLARRKLPVCRP